MGRADRTERALEAATAIRLAAAALDDQQAARRLRRAERLVLQEAGPSVPKGRAARLLGVSKTALERWIRSGRLPAARRSRGREEVEVTAFLDVLEEVRRLRGEDSAGPRVVSRAFRRLAQRGLPRPKLRPNQTARELRDAYQRSSPVERLGETAELSHAATALARYGARRHRGASDPV
jgi:hypothetical protein